MSQILQVVALTTDKLMDYLYSGWEYSNQKVDFYANCIIINHVQHRISN